MKLNLTILSLILLLSSCGPSFYRYSQLMQNYYYVERIIQNPDSLSIWVKDSADIKNAIFKFSNNKPKNIDELINKIKDNKFQEGYNFYDDWLYISDYKYYLEHRVWISSKKTGKKLFFEFNNKDDGIWKIEWIGLHIQNGIDYDIEIID
jgi:hypothetical protein